jgi:hypothetical protein
MNDLINPTDLICGEVYRVYIHDCCIEGAFTSTLIGIDDDTDDWNGRLEFLNGLTLTTFGGVSFYPIF